MKIYKFNEDNDEITVKVIPLKKKVAREAKNMKKFNDPGRKLKYVIVAWENRYHLMKWNGEKYSTIAKSTKKNDMVNEENRLREMDKHESRLRHQIKRVTEAQSV